MRTSSSPFNRLVLRISRSAPLCTLLVIFAAAVALTPPNVNSDALVRHRARIAHELDAFPPQLGRWFGRDVEIPTGAQDILRPNSYVSRRYVRLGSGESITLALVHCNDVRDMQGHYPPVCYPAVGWTPDPAGSQEVTLQLANQTTQCRLYRFSRADSVDNLVQQTVLAMFMLPGEDILTDMEDLKSQSRKGRSMSAFGVAQLQLVMGGSPPTETILVHATELLQAVPRTIIYALCAPVDGSMPLSAGGQTDSIEDATRKGIDP